MTALISDSLSTYVQTLAEASARFMHSERSAQQADQFVAVADKLVNDSGIETLQNLRDTDLIGKTAAAYARNPYYLLLPYQEAMSAVKKNPLATPQMVRAFTATLPQHEANFFTPCEDFSKTLNHLRQKYRDISAEKLTLAANQALAHPEAGHDFHAALQKLDQQLEKQLLLGTTSFQAIPKDVPTFPLETEKVVRPVG